MSETYKPINQERDERYNREPGITITPGSNFVREVAKFEQFHSQFTAGTVPGNPYTYRPYPKMLYRAEKFQGKPACMAPRPDEGEFRDPREYERATDAAERFTQRCQLIVNDDSERSRAMEQGWRESPSDAVAFVLGRDREQATAAAELNAADRGLSGGALRERQEALSEAADRGEHLAEVKVDGRSKAARAAKAAKPSYIAE